MTSCSKTLDRSEAQRQLQASYNKIVRHERFATGAPFGWGRIRPFTVPAGSGLTKLPPELVILSDAGMLTVTVTASSVTQNYMDMTGNHIVDRIAITPTAKGEPYFAGTSDSAVKWVAATPTIDIQRVTEPAEGGGRKVCQVAYNVFWKNTPVGDALSKRYPVDAKKAAFVKYDDGWKLASSADN